jgi:hypothetical protein
MITKDMALKAKQALIVLLDDSKISIGLSFGRKGYTVKVITQSNIDIPKSVLGVPIEVELTDIIIPYYDYTTQSI